MRGILQSLKQNETSFAQTALKANRVFEASDPKFGQEFKSILIKDVCELTKNLFTNW